MLISEVIIPFCRHFNNDIAAIATDCSEFLKESKNLPIFKLMASDLPKINKIKVRKRKQKNVVGEMLNKAFEDEFFNLNQRAVFVEATMPKSSQLLEPYFIFPVNGYKFIYSENVSNIESDYGRVMSTLYEKFENKSSAHKLLTEVLKSSYKSSSLVEAIKLSNEIIFYNIPAYYAVKCSKIKNYNNFLDHGNS